MNRNEKSKKLQLYKFSDNQLSEVIIKEIIRILTEILRRHSLDRFDLVKATSHESIALIVSKRFGAESLDVYRVDIKKGYRITNLIFTDLSSGESFEHLIHHSSGELNDFCDQLSKTIANNESKNKLR